MQDFDLDEEIDEKEEDELLKDEEEYEEDDDDIGNEQIDDAKCVVRCTLGGCFRYFHVNCVY